jgi:phosphopantothenoylcysteine decarboxylase/phosphopantothenate--cysteine ligase
MMLQRKKIILGITGGIAAYKCGHLVRLLVKEGAEVKVVMTRDAANFVTPHTLAVLSRNEVISDFFDANHNWNNHVNLALWADVLLVAPLTANTLAKMAHGICDNVLMATYLSARSKTIVAPAMDVDMYVHPRVVDNFKIIKNQGNLVIEAESGELASGLSGTGRMAEPGHIVDFLNEYFGNGQRLKGITALVNAGPTYEAIDAVRFIGNRSSGKMGIAIAEKLAELGASVTLVLGPSFESVLNSGIKIVRVESSHEMYKATLSNFEDKDIVICSAAVADYRPEKTNAGKIRKSREALELKLLPTEDILEELGMRKKKQFLVGFALETSDLEKHAREKLARKHLDMIVANSAIEVGSGFSGDTNKIMIIDKHNKITKFELKSKRDAATDIVNYIADLIIK